MTKDKLKHFADTLFSNMIKDLRKSLQITNNVIIAQAAEDMQKSVSAFINSVAEDEDGNNVRPIDKVG